MWQCRPDSVVFVPGDPIVQMGILTPDWESFQGQILSVQKSRNPPNLPYQGGGFDDWLQYFPREDEIGLVQKALTLVENENKRIHIRGISTVESIELIREYYASKGYEDTLEKNYTLPENELLTISISLRHALWCEKDKVFLAKAGKGEMGRGKTKQVLYQIVPPLRSPADLRVLQQALRMGIITGIEVFSGDEIYLPEIFHKQILSVFQLSQMVQFRWGKHGFSGAIQEYSFLLPEFHEGNI